MKALVIFDGGHLLQVSYAKAAVEMMLINSAKGVSGQKKFLLHCTFIFFLLIICLFIYLFIDLLYLLIRSTNILLYKIHFYNVIFPYWLSYYLFTALFMWLLLGTW